MSLSRTCDIDEHDFVVLPTADLVWRAARSQPLECCRWERHGGEWISVALSLSETSTTVVVAASDGRHAALDSLEDAMAMARSWTAA